MDFTKCSAKAHGFEGLPYAQRVGRTAPPRTPARRAAIALAGMLALALALASCGASPSPRASTATGSLTGFDGAALPANGPVHGFALTDQDGAHVSLSSYRGRVTLLSFLYPGCGAPCVLIAQQIRGALDELRDPPPVLIVSAQPAAGSPSAARRFLAEVGLSGRALYLTGPLARIGALWREYRVKPASAGRAAFASYAGVIVLDRRGSERVLFEQEQLSPEGLAHDIERVRRE